MIVEKMLKDTFSTKKYIADCKKEELLEYLFVHFNFCVVQTHIKTRT